jgi:CxxC-x17-CxxC domain-containing protein
MGFAPQGDLPPREMHKIVCTECGKEAEVPFKPIADRPVFCRDCFKAKRPAR